MLAVFNSAEKVENVSVRERWEFKCQFKYILSQHGDRYALQYASLFFFSFAGNWCDEIPPMFKRGKLRVQYETQGRDYGEETSISPLKLLVFVRKHLFWFTGLQGPIWATERVSSSPWPRCKWEARGPEGPATVADRSGALTAFRDASLDVDHIWFFVQPHYSPGKIRRRRGYRGAGRVDEVENEKSGE